MRYNAGMNDWRNDIGNKFTVRVTTKASKNRVQVEKNQDSLDIRVFVTAVAEHGKANKAVLKLLAKTLALPVSRLRIIQGEHHRIKTIAII